MPASEHKAVPGPVAGICAGRWRQLGVAAAVAPPVPTFRPLAPTSLSGLVSAAALPDQPGVPVACSGAKVRAAPAQRAAAQAMSAGPHIPDHSPQGGPVMSVDCPTSQDIKISDVFCNFSRCQRMSGDVPALQVL